MTPPTLSLPRLNHSAARPTAARYSNLGLGLGLLAFAIAVFAGAEKFADQRFTVHQRNALAQVQKIADAVANELQLPIHSGLTALAMAHYQASLATGQQDWSEAAHNDKLTDQLNQGGLGLARTRIVAADGKILMAPDKTGGSGSVADMGFFKAIKAHTTANRSQAIIEIGEPFAEGPSGSIVIPVARAIYDASGKLAGAILLDLDVGSISKLIREAGEQNGPDYGWLGLIRLNDATILASAPAPPADRQASLLLPQVRRDARGHSARQETAGHPAFIAAWARLSEVPLSILVSRDAAPVMLPATREVLLIRIAAAGIVLLTALTTALMLRRSAHQRTRVALALAEARQDATETAHATIEQCIESLPASIYQCEILPDESYIISYISKNTNAVLGPNLLNRSEPALWMSNAIPADRDIVAAFRRRARDTGHAIQEYRLANPEGGFTWVRHTARYLSRNPEGGGTAVGSLENIDDEIRLREEITQARIDLETQNLARAYDEVNTLIAGLPVVIFHSLIGTDGSVTRLFTSSNATAVYGPGPGDPSQSDAFQSRILPEDRHIMQEHLTRLRATDQDIVEFRMLRDKNDIFWVRTHARTIRRHADGAIECVGTTAEITQEVHLREQITRNRIDGETASVSAAYETLNSLLSDLPIAVVRVRCHADDRLEPLFHSAGTAKVLGPPRPDAVDPFRLTERISAEDRRRVHEALLQMRADKPFPTMEVACARGDDQTTWLRIHAYPTEHHPDGSFDYIGTLIDISDERQNRIRREINARLSTLGEMATGIAHELNQPLFLITMAGENAVLEAQKAAPNRGYLMQNLERLMTQATRAMKIVEHLQAFTRHDTEREKPVSLAAAIDGARSLIGGMLQQWQIELHLELPVTLPLILGQPTRIEQVLVNLLLNARDALNSMPVGQRKITLSANTAEDTVQLHVADTGTGVPDEILPRIFEPFFTTKSPNSSTGLGLSICHGAMRTMGGDIGVRNDAAGGAVFTLTFRIAETMTAAA